jgi:FtsH-binding integral membrane protein
MNNDTLNYFGATVATGTFSSIAWLTTMNDLVKIGSGYVAVIVGLITIYKFIKEQLKTKKS